LVKLAFKGSPFNIFWQNEITEIFASVSSIALSKLTLFMAYELIGKSIENKRNYRLSRLGLECRVEGSVFTMSHYGTQILKVDLYDGKVLGYGGYSKTDSAYINHALNQIAQHHCLDNNFRCRHSRRLNKIWLEDSEGKLYDMRLLDKN